MKKNNKSMEGVACCIAALVSIAIASCAIAIFAFWIVK